MREKEDEEITQSIEERERATERKTEEKKRKEKVSNY